MGAISSGKVSADVKPTSTLTTQQHAMSNALLGYTAGNLFGPTGTLANPQVYGGQRVAGTSPLQTQAYGIATNAPWSSSSPATGAAGNIMGYLSRSPQQLFQPVINAATNTWQREIMPSIMERQAGMDAAGSGGTTQALARAGSDLSQQLAGQLSQMQLQGMGIQAGALPAMQNWASMPTQEAMQRASLLAFLGDQQRGISKEGLAAEEAKWREGQPYANPMLGYALQLLPQSGQQMENVVSQKPRNIWSWIGDIF